MPGADLQATVSSMWLHKSLGTNLISAEIAMEIARLITRERYGQTEVDRNEPLTVEAKDSDWVITGSYSAEFNRLHPPVPAWHGPLKMRISQLNGHIFDYVFTIAPTSSPDSARASGEP